MLKNIGKYYLYRHIRLDKNEPFYIGIGSKKDKNFYAYSSEYERAYTNTSRSTFWKNITSKTDYEVEILLESDDYEFIKQKEIEFIALYKRLDCCQGLLVNLTDGGEGSSGRESWNKGTRMWENRIHPNLGKKLSKDTCKKKSESMKTSPKNLKGKKLPKEWCESISNAVMGEKNHMFGKTGELHHGSKKIINMDTFEVYVSMKEASEKTDYAFKYISENLLRENNYTPFVFYSEYLEKGEDYCKKICNIEKKNKKQGVKKVRNKTTGEIFETMKKASESIGMDAQKFRYQLKANKLNFEII